MPMPAIIGDCATMSDAINTMLRHFCYEISISVILCLEASVQQVVAGPMIGKMRQNRT
jgi:hypothetical protein